MSRSPDYDDLVKKYGKSKCAYYRCLVIGKRRWHTSMNQDEIDLVEHLLLKEQAIYTDEFNRTNPVTT